MVLILITNQTCNFSNIRLDEFNLMTEVNWSISLIIQSEKCLIIFVIIQFCNNTFCNNVIITVITFCNNLENHYFLNVAISCLIFIVFSIESLNNLTRYRPNINYVQLHRKHNFSSSKCFCKFNSSFNSSQDRHDLTRFIMSLIICNNKMLLYSLMEKL